MSCYFGEIQICSFSHGHIWPSPRKNLLNSFLGQQQYTWNLVWWRCLALIMDVSCVSSLILMICVYILLFLLHNFCPPVSKTSKLWLWLKRTTANQSRMICTVNVWITLIPYLYCFMLSVDTKFCWPVPTCWSRRHCLGGRYSAILPNGKGRLG